jgi:hypothetical protein
VEVHDKYASGSGRLSGAVGRGKWSGYASLPQRVVDRALETDRARATAEYLAQFRADIEGFVALEIVEACTGALQIRRIRHQLALGVGRR